MIAKGTVFLVMQLLLHGLRWTNAARSLPSGAPLYKSWVINELSSRSITRSGTEIASESNGKMLRKNG